MSERETVFRNGNVSVSKTLVQVGVSLTPSMASAAS